MDLTSLLGLALALAGIFVGHTLDGGRFSSLVQPAASLAWLQASQSPWPLTAEVLPPLA